jgi:hypothetical protein
MTTLRPALAGQLLGLLGLLGLSAPGAAQCQDGLLFAGAGPAGGSLGHAVDAAQGYAFAGAPYDTTHGTNAGSVTVFEYGPAGFVESLTLYSPTPAPMDQFGQALAAQGEWLVVGTRNDSAGLSPGAGVVYRLTPQGWTWSQTLTAWGANPLPYVGESVAIEGDRIALGAPGISTQVGAVYLFELQGDVWVEVDRVEPVSSYTVRGFGRDVALCGEQLIVGADYHSPGGLAPGAAFVFEHQQGAWVQTGTLVASDATWSDVYGQRVALEGGTAVVSGWSHTGPGPARGAVWVFERRDGRWQETQKLLSTPANGSRFGFSVDLEGDRLLVGARSNGSWPLSQSFVELFHRGPGGFGSELVRLGPPSGAGIGFGDAVALWGDAMLVGNSTGSTGAAYAGEVWFEDLPRVEASPYCKATPNSTGTPARIELACPGILQEQLLLRAAPVPDTLGLFLVGTTRAFLPLHNGFRCVGGTLTRLAPVLAQGHVLAGELDLAASQAAGGPLLPGSTCYVQAWFRDPAAGGAAANLTSGLAVTLSH